MLAFRTFLLFVLPLLARADGGVDFRADVAPLLAAHPGFQDQLRELAFDRPGSGYRISGRIAPALAGRRVGPYEFRATDLRCGREVRVRFVTSVRFFDEAGRLLAEVREGRWSGEEDIGAAVKAEEDVTAVEITAG